MNPAVNHSEAINWNPKAKHGWFRDHSGLWMVLILFLMVVYLVDPLREMAIDDDWAYALTVRHLLESGEYRLHDWATANMIVQAYWGTLFSKVSGFSFAALRISTLFLLGLGLATLYALLRDRGSSNHEAGLLTLTLLSSPLLVRMGFTFMTDVQFLAWLMISLWLYARAFSEQSKLLVVLASMAAAAAIGTRQFGMAMLAGLCAAWLFDRERMRHTTLYALGMLLPTVTAFWQLWSALTHPTFYMSINLKRQSAFLGDLDEFVIEFLWRVTAALQYLGLFLLPLMLLLAWSAWTSKRDSTPRVQRWVGVVWMLYISAGVVYGYAVKGVLMPSLLWNLDILKASFLLMVILTLVTSVFAVLIGWTLSVSGFTRQFWTSTQPTDVFLAVTAATMLGFHLVYVDFGDEYLISFLPFVILAFKRYVVHWEISKKWLVVIISLAILTLSCLWTRSTLEMEEELWKGADRLHARGILPKEIYGSWTWSCYHSAFQEWKDEIKAEPMTDPGGFFTAWLPQREKEARYRIVHSANAPSGIIWRVIEKLTYRDLWLQRRYLFVVEQQLPDQIRK
jgi:hypothetical protein